MSEIRNLSRRSLLGHMFSAGAFILAARVVPERALAAAVSGSTGTASADDWHPSLWLTLSQDGTLTIVAHRSEMGTGVRSSLPAVVAEEMDADMARVRIEQAIGDARLGSQDTDGSCSIRLFLRTMREVGASARTMLVNAAARKWDVPPGECAAKSHAIVHTPSGRSLGFGELATLAAAQPAPDPKTLVFKAPADYKYVGKDFPITDLDDMVHGRAGFGFDARMDGMLYASIERSPVIDGKLKSYDAAEALKVKGVRQVVTIDHSDPPWHFKPLGGVAVLGDNTWAVMQGREKLKVEWDPGPNAGAESGAYRAALAATARKAGKVVRNIGDVDAAFTRAAKSHEAEYSTPLLAHASMEPPASVAEFRDGKVIVWAATQNPQAVQETVAAALGIKKEDVTCHVTLLGGGFGRKSKPDYVAEAAILSKKCGKPVKVAWSREDDIRFDYYHSTASMYLKAGLDEKGKPLAWLQRSVFPPINTLFDPKNVYPTSELNLGWTDVPFDLPNHRVECGPASPPLRIGWLRSVASIYHAFAVHSFLDELAHLAGRDPLDYLLESLGPDRKIDFKAQGVPGGSDGRDEYAYDTGRLRRVIEIAADKSGWAKRTPSKGRALGICAHRSFLTYVASVVDLEVDAKGGIKIHRVDTALDAGQIVNADRVRAQFEGAAVFGTSAALMGEISFRNGRVTQSNFHNYPVARMSESPRETHVYIVPSNAPPAGVGEPGVPPIAPALCNAIFAATGKRIRELPIRKTKLA
jgi:isoquinoline 1-oxidoreductase beta subunit